jgi:hypothetical protein
MNNTNLKIETEGGYLNYYYGSPLVGKTSWHLDEHPRSAELRLFWYTEGRGNTDTETVDIKTFENPQMTDERSFQFQFPKTPFSYSGSLISIRWALELVIQPHDQVQRLDLVMSSTGYEIT